MGISIPVQNMVENSLEKNGPKVLLPQVIEAVTSLQTASCEASIANTLPSEPTTHSENNNTVSVDTAPPNKGELGSLDLPISIPGLNSNRKESGESIGVKSGMKKDGTGNTVEQVATKVKLKSKAGSESTVTALAGSSSANEEKTGSVVKVGGQKASKTKLKEKDDKNLSETEKTDVTKEMSELSEDSLVKGKGNGKAKKSLKEEKLNQKDRDVERQKISTREKETERVDSKEASDKDKPELELETPAVSEQTTESRKESKEEETDTMVGGSSTRRRKQSAPKRRSARLASLNEESTDEQDSTTSEKTNNLTEDSDIDSGSKSVMAEGGKKKATAATEKQAKPPSSSRMSGGASRKRLHVLESSSDDEEQETTHQNISSDEKGYESETEQHQQQGIEDSGDGGDRRQKGKRARKDNTTYETQPSESHTPSSKTLSGQKRSLSVGKDDRQEERRSSSPVTKKIKTKPSGRQEKKQSPNMQKSPSPVVVTRYCTVYTHNASRSTQCLFIPECMHAQTQELIVVCIIISLSTLTRFTYCVNECIYEVYMCVDLDFSMHRYNRRVKPNRRYTSPTEDSSSSPSNNDNDSVENS